MKRYRKPQFCADGKRQCEEPNDQGLTREPNLGKAPQHVPCEEEDCGSHEGHFCQFGPALSDAWNEQGNAKDAENEARAQH